MIRKNVMFDDESLAILESMSRDHKMNHSEFIRHTLRVHSAISIKTTVPEELPHIVVNGRHFKWNGKDSYVMVM